jgi:ABC-type multidrug transport system fused ATPase/permease subunit
VAPLVAAVPLALLLAACAVLLAALSSARALLRPAVAAEAAAAAASAAGAQPGGKLASTASSSELLADSTSACSAQLPKAGAAAAEPGAAHHQQQQQEQLLVRELRFSGITCSVAQRRSWVEALLGQRQAGPGAGEPALDGKGAVDVEAVRQQGAGRKQILQPISGCARSGQLLGILGPSGCGKSTLLGILAGQVCDDEDWSLGGHVSVDGRPIGAAALSRLTAFVPQDDFILRCAALRRAAGAGAARAGVVLRGSRACRAAAVMVVAHSVPPPW